MTLACVSVDSDCAVHKFLSYLLLAQVSVLPWVNQLD